MGEGYQLSVSRPTAGGGSVQQLDADPVLFTLEGETFATLRVYSRDGQAPEGPTPDAFVYREGGPGW